MSGPPPAPSAFHRPANVARILGCSEWWVKEQARRRRIPYCWIGGSYRFTDGHLVEIARLFEVRPTNEDVPTPVTRGASRPPTADEGASVTVIRLTARTPRRARTAASDAAA